MWIIIGGLTVALFYLWWQIYKLRVMMIGMIFIKEAKKLKAEMQGLPFHGNNIERD